jgi:PKD repeat protein
MIVRNLFGFILLLLSLLACSTTGGSPGAQPSRPSEPGPGPSSLSAALTADVTSGQSPLVVNFIARADVPDDETLFYTWDFGQGTQLEGSASRTFTYLKAGTFTASVTVSNGEESSTSTVNINVAEPSTPPDASNVAPVVDLTADMTEGGAPLRVKFRTQATDSDGDTLSYNLNFGDGTFLKSGNAVHTYRQPGTYTASVTVSDGQGHAVSDEVKITVSGEPPAAPPPPPDTPGVDDPPVVTVVAESTTGSTPVTTTFTAQAADPEGEALTYTWTFEPGVTREGSATESYTYSEKGTYQATVVVSDGTNEATNEVASQPVEVIVVAPGEPIPEPNVEPSITVEVNPTEGVGPLAVTITANAEDPNGDELLYSFDFGRSLLLNTPQAVQTRTFREFGYNYIYVEVTDGRGGYAWDYAYFEVLDPNNYPTVYLSATPSEGAAPLTVNFDAAAVDSDGDAISYNWYFDDGDSIRRGDPQQTRTYQEPGYYYAYVEVSDGKTGYDWDYASVYVSEPATPPPPEQPPSQPAQPLTVTLSASPTEGTAPLTVDFTAEAFNPEGKPLSYFWDFGFGEEEGNPQERYVYREPGVYYATVTVTDELRSDAEGVEIIVTSPEEPAPPAPPEEPAPPPGEPSPPPEEPAPPAPPEEPAPPPEEPSPPPEEPAPPPEQPSPPEEPAPPPEEPAPPAPPEEPSPPPEEPTPPSG